MADHLSIAARLVALLQISNAVLSSSYRFIGRVGSAKAEITRLIIEVGSLTTVLTDLKHLPEEKSRKLSSLQSLDGQHGACAVCRNTLEELEEKLGSVMGPTGARRRLLWPFESKVLAILNAIHNQKTTLELVLAGESTRVTPEPGKRITRIQDSVYSLDDSMKRDKICMWLT